MFKKLGFIFAVLPTFVMAQHNIKGNFSPAKDYEWVVLYKVTPTSSAYIANTEINENGDFEFRLDSTVTQGMYKLVYALPQEEYNFDIIYCDKTRDVATGKIDGFEVYSGQLDNTKPCIIVDDICDGGGTFIGLAKQLNLKGGGDLYLAVSHGIFSNGLQTLNDYCKRIYTTDSFINMSQKNKRLTIYPIGEIS